MHLGWLSAGFCCWTYASILGGIPGGPVLVHDDGSSRMEILKPPALKPGDIIGFAAPAGAAELPPLLEYKKRLEKAGYKVVIPEGIEHRRVGYLGGTDEQRAGE